MDRKRKIFWAKTGVILTAVPMLVWAYEFGPDAGYSGVPKEQGTCATAGCHVGTVNNPANQGSVKVTFPGGLTYTPGVKQHLVVTIADPPQRAWGFQLTARLASNSAGMAGSLASTDANTLLMCATANLSSQKDVGFGASQTCPSNMPLQYIEHSLAGYNASKGHTASQTYEFDWTPPATDSGDVVVYVSGNAANGDLTTNGDHIYNTSYTLKAAAAAGTAPAITTVESGAGLQTAIQSGSWVAIKGTNLANTNPGRIWRTDEVVNGNLPTSLDSASVTINGKPAFVYYVSPTQINVQAPTDTATGSVSVVVTNNGTASAPFTAQLQTFAPGFFTFGATGYAIATRYPDNALIANPGAVPGTVAAKAGDVLILWTTGFGPTNPAVSAGQVVTGAPAATTAPTVSVNGAPASVIGVALSPGSVGLYQVAVQLPASLPAGDVTLQASVGGVQSPTGVKLFIGQ
jgi:uncharacterized protein (TIGR03437 family)